MEIFIKNKEEIFSNLIIKTREEQRFLVLICGPLKRGIFKESNNKYKNLCSRGASKNLEKFENFVESSNSC